MKNLRNQKTKVLLSAALIQLLEVKPFEEIRLNEICEKAMVHKTTFYHHFEDKYDLLNYIIKETQKTMQPKIDACSAPITYYLEMAKEYIKNIKENAQFYKAILNSNQNGICFDIIYNLFVQDVKEKMQQYNIDVPANYVAVFYVSAVFSLINEWVTTGMKDTEEQLIKYIEILITEKKQV